MSRWPLAAGGAAAAALAAALLYNLDPGAAQAVARGWDAVDAALKERPALLSAVPAAPARHNLLENLALSPDPPPELAAARPVLPVSPAAAPATPAPAAATPDATSPTAAPGGEPHPINPPVSPPAASVDPAPAAAATSVAAPMPAAPPPPTPTQAWKLRAGETIYQLCRRAYGNCTQERLALIAQANPGINPRRLRAGQTMAVPVIARMAPLPGSHG